MPGISASMVKGYIEDGYDYLLETYEDEAQKEVAPLLYAEKEIKGEGWQKTIVVNSGAWRKTAATEGFVPSQPKDGRTIYARVFDFTQAASFTNDAVEDMIKMKDVLRDIAGGWGTTVVETREAFYARPFNYGGMLVGDWSFNGTTDSGSWTDPSGNGMYDGTSAAIMPKFNLVGNERSSVAGGTYYNGHALNLTPTNLKTVYLHATGVNNRRENDTIFNLRRDTLLVPTALSITAEEILTSTLEAYQSTNTKTVLNASRLKSIEWSYLTDSDAWFLGLAKKGMTMLKRMEPKFDFFQDKLNRCWWAVAETRFGFMDENWRYWDGSNFATA